MEMSSRPGKVFYQNGRPIPEYDFGKIDENLHIPVVCTNSECNGCMFCAGGLYACSVCGGLEGSMPLTCPGRNMSEQERDLVYAGELNFFHNIWWVRKPTDTYKDRHTLNKFRKWLKTDRTYKRPERM